MKTRFEAAGRNENVGICRKLQYLIKLKNMQIEIIAKSRFSHGLLKLLGNIELGEKRSGKCQEGYGLDIDLNCSYSNVIIAV